MRTHSGWMILAAAGLLVGSCNHEEEELTRRLLEANDKVLACQKELASAKVQASGLRNQLAQALANPAKVQLTDPETIQLVASLRGAPGADINALDPQKASAIVMNGAPAMQACYEKALKNNLALQKQSGIGLVLGITVRSTGDVRDVDVSPNVDRAMTECIRHAATRWKFPSFSGSAVTIEQKLTLTPKT